MSGKKIYYSTIGPFDKYLVRVMLLVKMIAESLELTPRYGVTLVVEIYLLAHVDQQKPAGGVQFVGVVLMFSGGRLDLTHLPLERGYCAAASPNLSCALHDLAGLVGYVL